MYALVRIELSWHFTVLTLDDLEHTFKVTDYANFCCWLEQWSGRSRLLFSPCFAVCIGGKRWREVYVSIWFHMQFSAIDSVSELQPGDSAPACKCCRYFKGWVCRTAMLTSYISFNFYWLVWNFNYLRFNSYFCRWTQASQYQNVSILDFIGAKDDGDGGDNWSYKSAKFQSVCHHQQTQHTTF